MEKWKLSSIVLLINLASSNGARCFVEMEGNKLKFEHCTTDDLKSYQVSNNLGEVIEIKANYASNNFSKLDDGIFKKFTNLEKLGLEDCNVSEISAGAFEGLSKLRSLDLGDNKIEKFDENVFKHLINLEQLDLYNNEIENLDKNLLKNNQKLTSLSLIGNKISSLNPDFLSCLKDLEELWITHNQITKLTRDTFEENRKLKTLRFSNNKILGIERDTFKNLDYLKNLYLDKNECIDKYFFDYPKINMSGVDEKLTSCYKNYDDLARESMVIENTTSPRSATCPVITYPTPQPESESTTESEVDDKDNDQETKMTPTFDIINFGPIWFPLFILSLLVNIILCIRKST